MFQCARGELLNVSVKGASKPSIDGQQHIYITKSFGPKKDAFFLSLSLLHTPKEVVTRDLARRYI